jgi:hypothetical protein
MNSNANDRYGSSLERTLAAGKPVDPATRLSELLAQSLEELTRPFDSPRPGAPAPVRAVHEEAGAPQLAEAHQEPQQPQPSEQQPQSPERHEPAAAEPEVDVPAEDARLDADRALAELEAELFAAAKQVDREQASAADEEDARHPQDDPAEDLDHAPSLGAASPPERREADHAGPADIMAPMQRGSASPEPAPDADAAGVIARVRRLMLVSMAITVIAVGSVFGFIGYRMYKGDGTTEKKADKLPDSSPISTDVTLSLPRGARVVQSAVANDRLVLTLEIDGKLEVRTFDVKTLQPAGRLNFSAAP